MFYKDKQLRLELPLPGERRSIVALMPHDVDADDLALVKTFVDGYSKLSSLRKASNPQQAVYMPSVWRVPMTPFDG